MRRAIVTGAAGFIGNAVAKRLIKDGWHVFAIDSLVAGDSDRWMELDCDRMPLQIQYVNVFPHERFDYVFHFGSPSSNIQFMNDPHGCKSETITGFIAAANLAKKSGAKLVFPSTSSIYGTLNDYAKTKLQLEALSGLFNMDALILRIFAGYGEGEAHKGEYASVVYQFCEQVKNGETIKVYGDGTQSRDFVYIDDIVDQMMSLLAMDASGIHDIGTGHSVSFNDLLKIIGQESGITPIVKYVENNTPNYLQHTKMAKDPNVFTKDIAYGVRKILASL